MRILDCYFGHLSLLLVFGIFSEFIDVSVGQRYATC